LTSTIDTTRAIEYLKGIIRDAIERPVPIVELKIKFEAWWTPNLAMLLARTKRGWKRMRKQYTRILGGI
jgi:hypothetical protein